MTIETICNGCLCVGWVGATYIYARRVRSLERRIEGLEEQAKLENAMKRSEDRLTGAVGELLRVAASKGVHPGAS